MKKIGEVFVDSEGYVVIRWKEDLGRAITVNDLQDKASQVANDVANILNEVKYESR